MNRLNQDSLNSFNVTQAVLLIIQNSTLNHGMADRHLGGFATAPLVCCCHIVLGVVQLELEVGHKLFIECDIHILAEPEALRSLAPVRVPGQVTESIVRTAKN